MIELSLSNFQDLVEYGVCVLCLCVDAFITQKSHYFPNVFVQLYGQFDTLPTLDSIWIALTYPFVKQYM